MPLHMLFAVPYTLTAYWYVCPYVQSVIIQSHTLSHWDGVATSHRSHALRYPLRWCFVCVSIGLAIYALSTLRALLPVSAEHAATITSKTISVGSHTFSTFMVLSSNSGWVSHLSVVTERSLPGLKGLSNSDSQYFSHFLCRGWGRELCWHKTRVLWHCVCNSMCVCMHACVVDSHCTSGPTYMIVHTVAATYCRCVHVPVL